MRKPESMGRSTARLRLQRLQLALISVRQLFAESRRYVRESGAAKIGEQCGAVQGGGMARVRISRRVHFSSAHRLGRADWSQEKNEEVFGLCASPNWHGHNYELDVVIEGEVA